MSEEYTRPVKELYTYKFGLKRIIPDRESRPQIGHQVHSDGNTYTIREVFWHTTEKATVLLK